MYFAHLALLGGSYCSTQLTSGISMPLAMTSVHTKIPLPHMTNMLNDIKTRLHTHTFIVAVSPFQGPKVSKDLVAFVFHLAVDAVDICFLDQNLQSPTVVLHTGTRTGDEITSDQSGNAYVTKINVTA